jgi:hypothetical protein
MRHFFMICEKALKRRVAGGISWNRMEQKGI